jgi:Domain of unknown function (DUF4382)
MRGLATGTLVCLIVALILAPSCSDSAPMSAEGGESQLRIFLTDVPSDYIASAEVTISHVYLVPNTDGPESVQLLSASESPKTFDLMDLRNGVQALLADATVPAGDYNQLRLVVDNATVTLVDGYTFADGTTTRTLSIPSSATAGIKVQLASSVEAADGEMTILVVDFDVNQSFVMQGSAESRTSIIGFTFIPVITETDRTTP